MALFTSERITDHLTRIYCPANVCAFLAEGSEKAALIDTGFGYGSIKEFVHTLTDKPLTSFSHMNITIMSAVQVNLRRPIFLKKTSCLLNDEYLWSVEHPGEEYVPMTYYMKQCETTCMKKPTYPGDIANTVAFLLSDQASNITGQHINVDCGLEFH